VLDKFASGRDDSDDDGDGDDDDDGNGTVSNLLWKEVQTCRCICSLCVFLSGLSRNPGQFSTEKH